VKNTALETAIHHQVTKLILLFALLLSCVGEKKPSTNAECAEGEGFDQVSRQCVNVRSAPAATLRNLSLFQNSGKNTVRLDYRDSNGEAANSCEVVLPSTSGIEANSPAVYEIYERTTDLVDWATDLAADIAPPSPAAITAGNNLRIQLNQMLSSTSLQLILGQRDAIFTGAETIANAAIATGNAVLNARGTYLNSSRIAYRDDFQHLEDRCLCQGGECTTIITPKFNFYGSAGFRYRVSNLIDGGGSFSEVNVNVQRINRAPLPVYQDVAVSESTTATAITQSLGALATPVDPDGDAIFTYSLISNPTVGTLSGCLGIGGAQGLNCNYRPNNGDHSDTTFDAAGNIVSVNAGLQATGVFNGMTLTAAQRGSIGNNIQIETIAYLGLGFAPVGTVSLSGDSNGPKITVVVNPQSTTHNQLRTMLLNSNDALEFISVGASATPFAIVSLGATTLSGGTNAQDSFVYRVTDTQTASSYNGVVNIRIIEQNDAPRLDPNTMTTTPANLVEDGGFTLAIPYIDPDSPIAGPPTCNLAPSAQLTAVSCLCSLVAKSCTGTFIPSSPNYNGTAFIDVSVTNDGLTSLVTRKFVSIAAINDAPVVETLNALYNDGLEDVAYEITNLRIHEGDGDDARLELSQDLFVRIVSANTTVVPNNASNIKIRFRSSPTSSDVDLNFDGTNEVMIPNTNSDAYAGRLSFEFIPTQDQSGVVPFTLHIRDNGTTGGANVNTAAIPFSINFVEVNDPPTIESIANINMNEGGVGQTQPFTVDEGGGPNEDVQTMEIRVLSDNQGLISHANIDIYYDTNDDLLPGTSERIGSGGAFVALGDGANSADLHSLFVRVKPIDGQTGTANLSVTARDSDGEQTVSNFAVIVHPVSAVHGGWEHVMATSKKTFPSNIQDPSKSCNPTPSECRPIGSAAGIAYGNCTGTVAPNSVVEAQTRAAIFHDTANNRCYYADATGGLDWQELNTFCPVSRTSDVPDCSVEGANCIGTRNPENNISPNGTTTRYYFRTSTQTCYRSKGPAIDDWETYYPSRIELRWKNFILAGTGASAGVSISGWNIYRRETGDEYNFNSPLATITNPSTRSYVDNSATENTVYFYLVQPLDSTLPQGRPTATSEVFSEIRVVAPPRNTAFVHRWMVNQEVCTLMNRGHLIETENNFRCAFAGPGDTVIGGISYYDIGSDFIVDLAEAGCPYTRSGCTANGCIGLGAPAGAMAVAGNYYYDRSSGTCHYSRANGVWHALDDDALISTDISVADMNRTLEPLNPPLVNIRAARANLFCQRRGNFSGIDGLNSAPVTRLPYRKEQIGYSSHPIGVSSLQNDQTERGLSLNSSSKCNSSAASGLEFAYTNTQVPATSFSYSVPGTETSDIRSIHTGSVPIGQSTSTQACVSRFGIQDVYGNVSEWVRDRLRCDNDNTCSAVNALGPAVMTMTANGDALFGDYRMDGIKGPCRDLNADGVCDGDDAPLTDWKIQDKSFDASFFTLPLGLPIHRLYPINNPVFVSPVSGSVLEIGPTSGITISSLHNDSIYVNAEQLMGVPGTRLGNMATGGGYLDGDTAGRWNFELVPEADVSSQTATGTLSAGGATLNITANEAGAVGNDITVRLIDGATAGSETVSVSGLSITVFIEDSVSTAAQIATAINTPGSVSAALVTASAPVGTFIVTEGVRLSGGRDEAFPSRPDIGYRCVAPIPYNTYVDELPTDD
jgi:hypothetical protein